MSPSSPILSFDAFSASMRGQLLLDRLSFSIRPGERVGLLGQSGSGKSFTARAALGILPPDASLSGSVRVNGTDVTHVPALARPASARVAMVLQDTQAALNPLTSIGYQLEQPLRRGGRSRAQARAEALALLDRVGLPDPAELVSRCSPELSGGQRQRVCIAIALASEAPLIIADEPTSALDVVTQAQILKLLRAVSEAPGGPALLFITHDLHAAAHLCQRALIIRQGRMIEDGPMAQILTAPRHDYTASLVAAARRCGIECAGFAA